MLIELIIYISLLSMICGMIVPSVFGINKKIMNDVDKIKTEYIKVNKGFIALSLLFWCSITIFTAISLESQWLSAYIFADFYRKERENLKNSANICLEKAYDLYISGVANESFEYDIHGDKCYGKTGDILEATTTSKSFWYSTTTKIHK